MRNPFVATILLSLSLACLPVGSNAATPIQPAMSGAIAKPFSLTCDAFGGGYQGYVQGHYYDYGSSKGIYITQYKIYQDPEFLYIQHKANINLRAFSTGGIIKEAKSPDNRRQDNKWHSVTQNIPNISGSKVLTRVEFIFSRPGEKDPRCTVELLI